MRTDSRVYHLVRGDRDYRATVTASYVNRTGAPVHFARCTSDWSTPKFGIARTGRDSTAPLLTCLAWACVGGVPTGVIAPGDRVTIRALLGGMDQTPPADSAFYVGRMRIHLELCRRHSGDSDRCERLPASESRSDAFTVRYQQGSR